MKALLRRSFLFLGLALGGALAAAAPETAIPAVSAERIIPALTAQLAAHFHLEGELQLELLRPWFPPTTPAAPWEMRVVGPPAALASQCIVRVRLVADERNLAEWSLPVRLQLWSETFVAREPVARGALLSPKLFDSRRIDLLRSKDAVLASSSLEGFTVSRPLDAGALLTWRDLMRRPVVQRGDRIDVVATEGGLTITMKALAMQSGALGETILVRNLESRHDFTAVVSAENQAQVAF